MMVIGDVAAPLSATGEDGPPGMVSQPAAPMTLIATKVVGETDAADKVKAPSVEESVPVTVIAAELVSFRYPGAARC